MHWQNQVLQPSQMAKLISHGQFFLNFLLLLKKKRRISVVEVDNLVLTPRDSAEKWLPVKKFIQGYARLTRIFSLDASIPCHAYSEVIRSDYLLCLPLQVIYYVNFYEPCVAFVCGLCAALRKPRARGGKKGICVLSTRSAKLVTHADYFCHSGLLWNV